MSVTQFTRRKINEWPKKVYLADFGDGDGCRPHQYIQYPDDTTPKYVRADIHDALRAEVERLREALTEIERIYLTECDADWRAAQMSAYATIELMDSAARATSPACQSGSATETTCEDEG